MLRRKSSEGVGAAGAILTKAVKHKIYFEKRVILCCLLAKAVQNFKLVTGFSNLSVTGSLENRPTVFFWL